MSNTPNTMTAAWCAARRGEARRWCDNPDRDLRQGRAYVNELLSQLDCPPKAPPVEAPPAYVLQPEAPGTESAGFDSHPAPLVGDSAALFADVRRKYQADLPGTLLAAKWYRLEEVLDHAEAATDRAETSAHQAAHRLECAELWESHCLAARAEVTAAEARAEKAEAQVERLYPLVRYQRVELHEAKLISNQEYAGLSALGGSHILDSYDELRTRTTKAEARVKEQQAEFAEQERANLLLIQETHRWSAAVKKLEAERVAPAAPCLSDCQAGRDGDCIAAGCPQLRDNEPERSGRSCPNYFDEDDD